MKISSPCPARQKTELSGSFLCRRSFCVLWACILMANIQYKKKSSLGHVKFSVMPWGFNFRVWDSAHRFSCRAWNLLFFMPGMKTAHFRLISGFMPSMKRKLNLLFFMLGMETAYFRFMLGMNWLPPVNYFKSVTTDSW